MTKDEKIRDPATHLLIIALGNRVKRELGGTKESSEILAEKIINLIGN